MDSKLEGLVRDEVERLHAFIAAWFRGELDRSNALFEEAFESRLAPGLINIQPAGATLTRSELLEGIRSGYGTNPNFRITISDVVLRGSVDRESRRDAGQGDIRSAAGFANATENGSQVFVLATYRERQQGAMQTVPPDNTRVTTVLMQVGEASDWPIWLHLHETAV